MDLCTYRYKFDNPAKDLPWCFNDDKINNYDEVGCNSFQHSGDGEPTSKTSQKPHQEKRLELEVLI